MHLVVPSSTEQDYVVLDSTAVSCSGLNGTGQDKTELSCYTLYNLLQIVLDWTRLDCC